MKKYLDKEIKKAQALRKKYHYSFAKLQKITGIPATTLRNWCKDDSVSTRWDTLLITNESRRKEIKFSESEFVNNFNQLDKNTKKILASVIYWCEGSKYPATNKVDLTNSDSMLLKLFKFLVSVRVPSALVVLTDTLTSKRILP